MYVYMYICIYVYIYIYHPTHIDPDKLGFGQVIHNYVEYQHTLEHHTFYN